MRTRRADVPLLVMGLSLLACDRAGPAAAAAASDAPAPAAVPAVAGPRPPGPCDGVVDRGERLKCKLDRLTGSGSQTADLMQAPPYGDLFSAADLETIGRARDRLHGQRARIGAADLKAMTKKRDATCRPVECDPELYPTCRKGDGDGVCGPGEDCLEVVGDGAGDDVQPCAPMKGSHREECVVTCDDAAVCSEEANLDDDATATLEGLYDDMADQLDEANVVLAEAAPAIRALVAARDGADPCALDAAGLTRTSAFLIMTVRLSAVLARGAGDVAERVCDSTAFGWSTSAGCAPFEVAAGLLAAPSDLLAVMEGTINSATIDAAFDCVGKVNDEVNGQVAKLDEIEAGVGRVEALQAEIVRLLNTPPGGRPGYPQIP